MNNVVQYTFVEFYDFLVLCLFSSNEKNLEITDISMLEVLRTLFSHKNNMKIIKTSQDTTHKALNDVGIAI